jgi:hypothetical protein
LVQIGDFITGGYICTLIPKIIDYGTAGSGKHQKALGFILFLVDRYQYNALSARNAPLVLAGFAFCLH